MSSSMLGRNYGSLVKEVYNRVYDALSSGEDMLPMQILLFAGNMKVDEEIMRQAFVKPDLLALVEWKMTRPN